MCLIGPTRFGKTAWARSLGLHNYYHTYFDFKNWNENALYTIFDDIDFNSLNRIWKSFFGCQKNITVTDKYVAKKNICNTYKCFIFLCNEDNNPYTLLFYNKPNYDFLNENCIQIKLINRLY